MRSVLFILCLIVFAKVEFVCVYGQVPTIEWEKTLGGTSNDKACFVTHLSNGGFIVIGTSESSDGDVIGNHGTADVWVINLDSNRSIVWQRCYGGTYYELANSAAPTSDNGYIIAGSTYSNDGDVSGNHDSIVPGLDIWILKIDSSGNLQWQKCLGGSQHDEAYVVKQTFDGGYVVGGYTESNDGDVTGNHGGWDAWIIKTDNIGNIQWQNCVGGSNGPDEWCTSVVQSEDSGYLFTCIVNSSDGDITCNPFDYWIGKLNSGGGLIWQICFGGSSTDEIASLMYHSNGYFTAFGTTFSIDGNVTGNHGNADYWLVKFSSSGTVSWEKCYGGSWGEGAKYFIQTLDGGYLLWGNAGSFDGDVTGNHLGGDYWLVKTDSMGSLQWEKCLGGNANEEATWVEELDSGTYLASGGSSSDDGDVSINHGGMDYWIVELSQNSNNINYSKKDQLNISIKGENGSYIFEFNTELQIRNIEIYDLLGSKLTSMFSEFYPEFLFIDNLCRGLYFLRISTDNGLVTKKVTINY